MQQSDHTVHAITCEQIGSRKDNHDQSNREDHRRDGTDKTWSVCLKPWGRTGGERERASKRNETSSHKRVDEHFINSHTGFFGTDARDELGRLLVQNMLVESV